MKSTQEKERIAYCGVNCSACPVYLTSQEEKEMVKKRITRLWPDKYHHYEASDFTCKGCQEPWGKKPTHCQECEVRECARKKLYSTCAECANYPCIKLQNVYKRLDKNVSRVDLDDLRHNNIAG